MESSWSHAVLCRLAPSHRPSPSSTSTPEVRVLPSTSVTWPRQYYDPVRPPPVPPPVSVVEAATLTHGGSPPITRITLPACRAHYPGGSRRVRLSIASPLTRPSPLFRRVGIRNFTFEACSDFTHITARLIAQPPIGGLCHEASTRPVTRTSRSSATRSIDNSLGGSFLHWWYAPSGRTE